MRKSKRNSSSDILDEEQESASILSGKKRKTDNSEILTRRRRSSQAQRSCRSSRQAKGKANEKNIKKKKESGKVDLEKNVAPTRKRRTSQVQRSSSNRGRPKTKANKKAAGKKKALAKENIKEDSQTNAMQILPQDSVTDIDKEVNYFIRVLYGKKQELEEGAKRRKNSKPKLILTASESGRSSDVKGENARENTTSDIAYGVKNVPSKTADSDPKFKLIRESMYS